MQDDTLKTFQNAFLKALLDPTQSSQAFTHFIGGKARPKKITPSNPSTYRLRLSFPPINLPKLLKT